MTEILPPESGNAGIDLLRGGAAIVKAENDSMAQVALTKPRDEQRIYDGAIAELERLPDLAERIYYSIPYKNHVQGCVGAKRKTCDCPSEPVRGVSIKGANNLARRWGNCSATVRVVEDDEDKVTLEGVFLDLETNYRSSVPKVASKWRTWKGKRTRQLDEKMEQLVASTASKAKRNAILDGLPDWLVEGYYQKAREIVVAIERGAPKDPAKPQETLADRIMRGFEPHEVAREVIERYLGNPLDDVSDEQIADLRGILNALNDREIDVAGAFGIEDDDTEKPDDGKTIDDIVGDGAEVKGGHVKADEPTDSTGLTDEQKREIVEQEKLEAAQARLDQKREREGVPPNVDPQTGEVSEGGERGDGSAGDDPSNTEEPLPGFDK